MNELNDLKQIWLTASVQELPTADAAMKTIKKYQSTHLVKSIMLLCVTIILCAIMCWVVFVYNSALVVTRIGEACMLIAIGILFRTNTKNLRRISAKKNYNNNEFIIFLKEEQLKQLRYTKRTQVIGFLFATTGLLLYLFEPTYQHTIIFIITYALAIVWIVVCWFVLRPISLRRKTKHLTETIQYLERVSVQFDNN